MIGLDTNVLVRFLTQDDTAQSPRANRLMSSLTAINPGFISTVAIIELDWVLDSFYGFSKPDRAAAIMRLLSNDCLLVENEHDVFVAMTALADGADFADALIGMSGIGVGCEHTVTFNRKALRLSGFASVP
ncbi:MAG TPA: type II toxin-antitoxin system VapC family toxin [Rhizomicrobium sp.]|jgi:predicted nucleic-acid-binding protein|nr:type II toxin-antitoxin system VapC family toxin [Rhizomicrobium sp.]